VRTTDPTAGLRDDGCALLEDVLDDGTVQRLRADFLSRHASSAQGRPARSLRVGDRRYMVTVSMRDSFADPRVWAAPAVCEPVAGVLGPDWKLFSLSVVVSQPGAQDQHVHSDSGGLFGDPAIEGDLPCYAVTALLPLVDADERTGSTRLWPGSHRLPPDDAATITPVDPVVRAGSAVLFDYRLRHGGIGNRSDIVRPVLSLVYARPWFRDATNFTVQHPLVVSRFALRRLTPEHRALLLDPVRERSAVERRARAAARRAAALAGRG
jgi:ectoine hydroxylase-related dioxygenase (phytanoyl-CoA dioxygenase family)